MAVNERAIGAIEAFLGMTPDDLPALSNESVRAIALGLRRADTFDPGESALAALVAGNILEQVEDRELRDLVAGWSGRVSDLREEQTEVRRAEAAIRQHMAVNLMTVPPLGGLDVAYTAAERLRLQMEDEQTRQLYAVRYVAISLMLREQTGLSVAADRVLALLDVVAR